jgi:hypothetical protein
VVIGEGKLIHNGCQSYQKIIPQLLEDRDTPNKQQSVNTRQHKSKYSTGNRKRNSNARVPKDVTPFLEHLWLTIKHRAEHSFWILDFPTVEMLIKGIGKLSTQMLPSLPIVGQESQTRRYSTQSKF